MDDHSLNWVRPNTGYSCQIIHLYYVNRTGSKCGRFPFGIEIIFLMSICLPSYLPEASYKRVTIFSAGPIRFFKAELLPL